MRDNEMCPHCVMAGTVAKESSWDECYPLFTQKSLNDNLCCDPVRTGIIRNGFDG